MWGAPSRQGQPRCKGPGMGPGRTELAKACSCSWLGNQGTKTGRVRPQAGSWQSWGWAGWRRHTGAGTFAPRPDPSRLLEGQLPQAPAKPAVQWPLLPQFLCLMTSHVFHPQLIVQQASVDLPPSGPASWLGTRGPVALSRD